MASSKLKGITVEIGGDTTGLDKALKDTNKNISDTQRELSQVERLLKLDPKNTELVAQKQKLLSDAVTETKNKLDTLKKAKEKADKDGLQGTEEGQKAYRELQREIIATEQKMKSYNDSIDDTSKKFDALGTSASKMNKVMATAGAGVLALGGGLVASAVNAGKAADDINTLAKVTGLSTEEIQKFSYASDIIDVSLDTLTGSMAKLTKNMATASKGTGDAYKAFNELGVAITDTEGNMRNNQDVFDDVIAALGAMENETQRDAYAMQIFGKSAQELNPLILGGADALKELGKEAEEAGLILSQEALDSANEFNDSIDKLKATASGAFSVIGTEIATALIPVMEKVGELVQWLLDNRQPITVALAAISAGILAFNMVTMIQNMVKAFQAWKTATQGMTLAQQLLNLAMSANPIGLIVTLIAGLVAALVTLWNTNDGFRNALIGAWNAILDTAKKVWGAIVEFFTVQIPAAFNAVIDFVKNNWQSLLLLIVNPIGGALKLLYDLNPKFREWVNELLAKIKEWFGKIRDVGKNLVEGLWNGIIDMKNWIIDKVKSFAAGILDSIKEAMGIHSPSKETYKDGVFLAQGLGLGFEAEMPKVINAIADSVLQVTDTISSGLDLNATMPKVNQKVTSQNYYTTKNYQSSFETVKQPVEVVLELNKTQLGRVLVPIYENQKKVAGVSL